MGAAPSTTSHEIIDYASRQAAGKPIGSGRMEKDLTTRSAIGRKKRSMPGWSAKGNKAPAILNVVEINKQWQPLWFPEEGQLKTAA